MPKSAGGEINWSRLLIVGACVVLAAVLWAKHTRVSDSQTAAIAPVAAAANTSLAANATVPIPPDPQDRAGWRTLGETRFQAGQYAEAVAAYQHAVALAPSDAMIWAALGEARVMASARDPMPADALKDFREAASIDPKEPRARYFLAVEKDLTGDHDGAIDAWLALLRDTPPGAPWEADLRRTIAQVGTIRHIAVAARIAAVHQPAPPSTGMSAPLPAMAGIAGPTAQDLQAASAIPPSQQQAMANAMVARLEQRLAADPHNGEGWAMLIRSRMTLDGSGAASAALARAVVADPADAAQLREQARVMGVK